MNSLVQSQPRGTMLAPQNMAEAMRFAELLADSSMVPRDFQGKPGNVLVAVQWGQEIGLGPMQALQNIAVIGGRPALWGDAVLALVRAHPQFVSIEEGIDGEGDAQFGWCDLARLRRDGSVEQIRREFSVADAKRAKLWTKAGPWTEYPQRMLMLRARGWAVRDLFTDALRGLVMVEEARDMPRDVPNLAQEPPPQNRGPVRAVAGSLAEHAAAVTGRAVEPPPPAEPEEELPLVYIDGRLVGIKRGAKSGAPAIAVWRGAALQQTAKAESREALRLWRLDNGPNFGAVAEVYPAEVAEVEAAVEARLEQLRFAPVSEAEEAAA